jgi:hypothetical protein
MQNVSIQKASDLPVSSSEGRAQVDLELEGFLNRRAEKTEGVPDSEIEAAVDEAVDHVRHSRG